VGHANRQTSPFIDGKDSDVKTFQSVRLSDTKSKSASQTSILQDKNDIVQIAKAKVQAQNDLDFEDTRYTHITQTYTQPHLCSRLLLLIQSLRESNEVDSKELESIIQRKEGLAKHVEELRCVCSCVCV